ncbi:hypothetical protein Ancab_023951 [Ancistrocladus abbreviatus]
MATVSPEKPLWWSRGLVRREKMVCHYKWVVNKTKGYFHGEDPFDFLTSTLLAQLILIFLVSRSTYFLLRHLQQNLLTAQIIAGIMLGPSLITRKEELLDKLFPPAGIVILKTFGYFGFMIHVFGLGVNINVSLFRGIGRRAVYIGLSSFVGSTVASLFSYVAVMFSPANVALEKNPPLGLPVFILVNSVSSFIVVASHLMYLNLINSELGNMASSAALVTDACGWFITAFLANVGVAVERYKGKALYAIVGIASYYFTMFFILRPLVIRITRDTPQGKPMKEGHFFIIITLVLCVGFLGECIGQGAAVGVFLFGLALPDGPPLGLMLMQKLDTVASGLLLPIFCTLSGLRTNIYTLRLDSALVVEAIIMMGYVGKFTGTLLSAITLEIPFQDALPLALLMCCKGLVELAVYGFCKDSQIMTDELFTLAMLTMIIATGIIVPLVKHLYDPSTRYMSSGMQTVLHTEQKGVFRILVCIHKEDNVPTIVNLLNASNPTRESPLCVFVLQLTELVGHKKAILAPHSQPSNPSLNRSHSERIVNAFSILEKHNLNVKVHHFTGVAPYATMHNDICTVAHDRVVSIIIVPYHKQWGIDGTVDASHTNIRKLNKNVLRKAPCSVGLLIDRGHLIGTRSVLTGQSLFSVAVLFLGGDDDHEALAYGRRMAENPDVKLIVIWIRSHINNVQNDEQKGLDWEIMQEFLASAENQSNIVCTENFVDDGVGTTSIARSLENQVDLLLVGRHHEPDLPATSGLAEWSECPEIGAIGDMLASWDLRFSVLVVQQQPRKDDFCSRQFSMQSFESRVTYDSYRDEFNPTTQNVFSDSRSMHSP